MMDKAALNDRCMSRVASTPAGHSKAASITVFLVEELGDARVRSEQLKKYIEEATGLIEKSEHRDHFFEVAGHLLHGIPEVLLKLEKAIEAASMAASRIDYEEIKERLKPEKVEELEKALQDVRIRNLRRSEGQEEPPKEKPTKDAARITKEEISTVMNAKIAAYELSRIADHVETTGAVPMDRLVSLIGRLERGKREASSVSPTQAAGYFRALAEELTRTANEAERPSRFALAQHLRKVVADVMPMTSAQVSAQIYQQANSREEVMKGFKAENPALTDDQLKEIADQWEKNKDVVKDIHQ
jgi:hypothetical protein